MRSYSFRPIATNRRSLPQSSYVGATMFGLKKNNDRNTFTHSYVDTYDMNTMLCVNTETM